jgi:addiction module RelE/StbE family toxin
MRYILSKRFEKDFAKLPKSTKEKAIDVFELFVVDSQNPGLRVHPLKGRWVGHFSIDITGDTRAIYFIVEKDMVRFVAIGSHSQLYG